MSNSNTVYRTAIVQRFLDGRIYQLFAAPEALLLYHIGGDFTGIKSNRMQRPDGPLRPLGARDLRIRADQVERIRVVCADSAPANVEPLRVKLKIANGRGFTITCYQRDEQSLIRALRDFAPDRRIDPDGVFSSEPTPEQAACNPARAAKLRILLIAFALLCLAIDIPLLLFRASTAALEAISLAVLPIILMLYCLFPNELTLADGRRRAGERVRIPYLVLLSAFTPALRALDLYPSSNWLPFGLASGIVLLIFMALLALATREWRKYPSYLLILAIALFYYIPGLIAYTRIYLLFL